MWAERIFVAKRLECADFSGAVERAKNLKRRVILLRAESGAEVTAVQTLREFRGATAGCEWFSEIRELFRVVRVVRG
jgi:hypothetical protein